MADDSGLPTKQEVKRLEDKLSDLAMAFRVANSASGRTEIAEKYRNIVEQLLSIGWADLLDVESELPDEYMPTGYLGLHRRSSSSDTSGAGGNAKQ